MSPPAATVAAADVLIRTTARIQEAAEPPRHKPIIKMDPKQHHDLMGQNLADGSIRASIDSGRDNPFRPDGEIYKLTNPIVDYYKFGPNQSRSATPTYAELDYFSSKNKRKRRAEKRAELYREGQAMPCWRRWFCCCCPRRRPTCQIKSLPPSEFGNSSSGEQRPNSNVGDTTRVLMGQVDGLPPATTTSGNDLKRGELATTTTTTTTMAEATGKQRQMTNKSRNSKTQPTKKVQLDDETTTTNLKTAARSNGNATSTAMPMLKTDEEHKPKLNQSQEVEPKATIVKTVRTNKCVIS